MGKNTQKTGGGSSFCQTQYVIGRYIADFFCSEAYLAVEVDGKIHQQWEQKEYDQNREYELGSRSIKIIRFTNEEIYDDIDSVIEKIKNTLLAIARH